MNTRDTWREIDRLYYEQQTRPVLSVKPRLKLTKRVR